RNALLWILAVGAVAAPACSANDAGTSGAGGGAAAGAGGAGGTSTGGSSGTAGGAPDAGGSGGLPPLTVNGTKLQDPSGKTIILRGSSLIDIGSLYAYGGNSSAGIMARLDKVAAAGVQGHVVRLPVYPKIDYNAGYPTCSPLPYPVGTGPSASCTPTTPMTAADYDSKVLKPAVDYATSKNLYVIIDHHQIDNATTGTSAADATTFWTDVAPQFAGYSNVFYEPFNEPIDGTAGWAALKPVVQGWIDTIRAVAPNNIIIVPSTSYDQHPGDAASDPPTGTNLMFTAHVYPQNWNQTFQTQVTTAVAKAPVFMTEWGYTYSTTGTNVDDTSSPTWGQTFQTFVDGAGASWTAWVTDNAWTPSIFTDPNLTQLSTFGTLVQTWLATDASADWVQ
ncbi:MAG TPA: cellulase family glycosylhydrolase, partial [Polyangia bacterium]|nr:cellulase family glycosylhydrolase [Polyangia bacterium]